VVQAKSAGVWRDSATLGEIRRITATGRLSQAKLPIYKKFSDRAHTHRFREKSKPVPGVKRPEPLDD